MRKNKNEDTEFRKPKKSIFKKIKFILIVLIILVLYLAITTGIEVSKWQKIALDMIHNTPSIVLDSDGEIIAEIGTSKNTSNLTISNIPDNIKNAYISIEDQRFYSHHGVDFPRTAAAVFTYIKNMGSSSFGGSSITQQLVKNLTGDNSSKVSRKVNEWTKALSLETVLSKEEILEAYLNIIYVGPNIYGVDLGTKYYFNKDIKDLSLAECAFLAGINNSPNSYNPFGEKDNNEKIRIRTTAVLDKMLELGYIQNEEHTEAINQVNNGLKFKKGKIENKKASNIYNYHTDALVDRLIKDLAEKKNISTTFATNYIEMSGFKIYSTQNSKIQNTIETELNKSKYVLKSQKNPGTTSQSAMVVIDHTNGYVLGCVGGIGKKEVSRGFNRATQAYRQTGSAGKPIAILVPAIDKHIITPASVYNDELTTFDDGTPEGYSPTNYNNYKGEITVRSAVETSQNIPFVKIMEELTPKTSISYMKKMGITSLTKTDENLNLALGGLDKGITPLEMAAAYATIANDGVYIEPTFYIKVVNMNDKTIVASKQKTHRAFSEAVAFIVKDLLTQPVIGQNGTAVYCNMQGMSVAAKTGTTNNDYDRWLCGFTPYYTAVTWFGFDQNETIHYNRKNPSGQIWASVMKELHNNLPRRSFIYPDKGVTKAKICPTNGLLARTECEYYYNEYFLDEYVPLDSCTKHIGNTITHVVKPENKVPEPTVTPTEEPVQEQTPAPEPETQIIDNSNVDISKPQETPEVPSVPIDITHNDQNPNNEPISSSTGTEDETNIDDYFDPDDETFSQ